MRIIPGTPQEFANETPMSHHLMKYMVSEPEIIPQIATLFRGDHTAFTSLLADRGLSAGSLYAGMDQAKEGKGKYRVIGNRKVMWAVKGLSNRKGRMTADATCEPYPTEKGKYQSLITIYLDTNWFSPYDVLELQDNRTQIIIADDQLPQETSGGQWRYYARLVTNQQDASVTAYLLAEGAELGFVQTAFYEMSETAYEKYTFNEMATTHLTIQRMKWSVSGTAQEMKPSVTWVQHSGQKLWTTHAELQMLERWARAREYQTIFGKGTVTANDDIVLRDVKGREIMAGDGLLNQGDGALKFQYNKLTTKVIENVMDNMALYSNNDGVTELALIGGRKFLSNFNVIMKTILGSSLEHMVEGTGANKGVNATYAYYEFNGVRIVPRWHKWFDSPERPFTVSADGSKKESNRGVFVSLGNYDSGSSNIELLALGKRSFLKGTVAGINDGGENMSHSVDGKHVHVLSETGIALMDINGVAELYMP